MNKQRIIVVVGADAITLEQAREAAIKHFGNDVDVTVVATEREANEIAAGLQSVHRSAASIAELVKDMVFVEGYKEEPRVDKPAKQYVPKKITPKGGFKAVNFKRPFINQKRIR